MNEKSKQIITGGTAFILASAAYFFLPDSCPEAAKRAAFVFVIAAIFWAMEVIPLYATSLVVIILEMLLLGRPGGVLGMDANGYTIFFAPFSSRDMFKAGFLVCLISLTIILLGFNFVLGPLITKS